MLLRNVLGYFAAVAVAACVTLGAGTPALADPLELRFLDVGQGDAALLRHGDKNVLIDTGPSDAIVDRLKSLGVASLDLLVVSHNHADHLGGADAVLAELPVRHYMDNGWPAKTKIQETCLRLVEARGVTYLKAKARRINLGDAFLKVLPPPDDVEGDAQNNRSVGLLIVHGSFAALLTGDSEMEELAIWLRDETVPDVALLKAPHHGSRNGLTPAWLQRTKPEVVVISLGADNPYGHPHDAALRYYRASGRRVLRTDEMGDVVVRVANDGSFDITGARTPPSQSATDANLCCRICHKGKACGDGCIGANQSCSKPSGCACDG